MTLVEFLQAKGFDISPDLSGQIQRFPRPGCKDTDQPGWFQARHIQVGEKTVLVARFGDWRNPEEVHVYQSESENLSPDEARALASALEALEAERKAQQAEDHAASQARAEDIFCESEVSGDSPYLVRKRLTGLFGARLSRGNLVVPLQDVAGKIWSLQFIRPDGSKQFLKGGKIRGNFHPLNWPKPDPLLIFICEGFATAASIAMAFEDDAVVCAFNAGNLVPVAQALREAYPKAQLVIAGDDDQWGRLNAGRSKALHAAEAVRGTTTFPRFPAKVADQKPTDWNDLHCLFGLEEVRAQVVRTTTTEQEARDAQLEATGTSAPGAGEGLVISKPTYAGLAGVLDTDSKIKSDAQLPTNSLPTSDPQIAKPKSALTNPGAGAKVLQLVGNGGSASGPSEPAPVHVIRGSQTLAGLLRDIRPINLQVDKKGNAIPPTQQRVVDHLMREIGPGLIKQGRDLFHYTGTHWRMFEVPADHDRLKVAIQAACQGLGDMRFIDQAYKLLVTHLPSPPEDSKGEAIDLFRPLVSAANFMNGTLHAVKTAGAGGYALEFREHSPRDFLINVLPYEYRPEDGARNADFEEMLGRVFQGDPDLAEKVRAVGQMFGAALMPIFPHLFMLTGVPGTGKSTVMKILARLVSDKNMCSVPPNHFNGFHMESMAGKLVNIHTDIPSREPIDDDVVKQLVDRMPFPIRRKGIKDLLVPLPALHVFGANSMPPTLEGSTGAHERRWTFLRFNQVVARAGGDYDKEFDQACFEASPQGVLNFALAGLRDLLQARGHYTNPVSGKELIEDWQSARDPVALFVKAVADGEILEGGTKLILDPEAEITRPQLWLAFELWFKSENPAGRVMGRTQFFAAMRNRKFRERKTEKARYFMGLGVRVAESARQ